MFTFWAITTLIGVTGIAVATVFKRLGSEDRRVREWMRATRRSTIAEAPEGAVVRLVGKVTFLDGKSVEAALTGRRCAFFEAHLETMSDDATFDLWKVGARETGGVPFAIDDGTARAVVDPDLAQVTLHKDVVGKGGELVTPNEREAAFLKRHARPGDGWMLKRLHRWKEGILEEGETIAVVGVVMREADPSPNALRDYRQDAVRLRLASGAGAPVSISDEKELTR